MQLVTRKLLSPIAGLAILMLCSVVDTTGIAAQQTSDHELVIRNLVDRYANAREGENPTAIRALFVENADQLVSSGEWRRGRESLVSGMLASSRNNPGSRTIEVQTVRFLGDNVAIADARYEIAASPNRAARQMWSTFVVVKVSEGWKIAAIRNMLPAN